MSDLPQIVRVQLNSGVYQAKLLGKVAAKHKGKFFRMYEVELIDHPKLKNICVRRGKIIGTIE
jgi:hypothetical protein